MSMFSYCSFMYLHCASWHSSATLTEVSPCSFVSCKENARVKPAKTVHGTHCSKNFVLFYVLCLRVCVCVCVNVYCTTATVWLPNCRLTNISYQYVKFLNMGILMCVRPSVLLFLIYFFHNIFRGPTVNLRNSLGRSKHVR